MSKSMDKKNTLKNSTLNILEYLYLSYDQELVNMLWHKQIDKDLQKQQLRDDFSHWVLQLVNYWVSFNDSSDDTVSEIIHTVSSANFFFSHRMILFLLTNYFDEMSLIGINEKYIIV